MPTAALESERPDDSGPSSAAEAALIRGALALREHRWEDARDAYGIAARENRPDAWEGLGFACWGLQDAEPMFDARGNAYRLYQALGKRRDAARVAALLANDHLDFRGEGAVANGWLKRAQRLLDDVSDADVERAWLAVWIARLALVSGEADDVVEEHIGHAIDLGSDVAVADVEGLALALRGTLHIAAGDIRTGMTELDEATVAAVSGEMRDPYAIGITCCYLIAACERTRDFDRAAQWCEQLRAYLERERTAVVLTNCRLQYASVLLAQGDWGACERELDDALDDAQRARPSLLASANARRGELRRRQGRRAEAAELFAQAGNHGAALLGGAALDIESGALASAAERLERYTRRLRPEADMERALALELVVRLAAARQDDTAAEEAVRDLADIAERFPSACLSAALQAARGIRALGRRDTRGAAALEDAADAYASIGLPFEAAECRLLHARAFVAKGTATAARRSARAAHDGFRRLGSERAAEAEAVLDQLRPHRRGRDSGPLTARETEVLRLVSDGLPNTEIAERLVVSPHTIHRHLANIRRKLGVSSRAAAVARGLREGLL